MSKTRSQPHVTSKAIHVETAATVQGPAATSISVEVDEEKLGRDVADGGQADRAVALIPRTHGGKQEWNEEELRHAGRRITDDDRVVKTFNATVRGPIDAKQSGVSVKVETPGGAVWANDQDSRPIRDADKPAADED
ncbi:hypothetical protein CYFUS_003961 [Cystobacter fuscus]|uniref:Uncharacterized protein n=1 Tax=Cystobacter fuscus TaxID=43 RepID=A0A250J5S0_9BACT|nr:hypothetical protein [Cystobacter fuscus]ATB38526.1 hypothetical protein CYFUS_003961 [Cystobacter fuscus]